MAQHKIAKEREVTDINLTSNFQAGRLLPLIAKSQLLFAFLGLPSEALVKEGDLGVKTFFLV
jgi:hypothetical protein